MKTQMHTPELEQALVESHLEHLEMQDDYRRSCEQMPDVDSPRINVDVIYTQASWPSLSQPEVMIRFRMPKFGLRLECPDVIPSVGHVEAIRLIRSALHIVTETGFVEEMDTLLGKVDSLEPSETSLSTPLGGAR